MLSGEGRITLTMVRLCRMKVWRPSHRNFMQSSKTTTIRANSSRVAWTCGQRVRGGGITGPHTHAPATSCPPATTPDCLFL